MCHRQNKLKYRQKKIKVWLEKLKHGYNKLKYRQKKIKVWIEKTKI